MADFQPATVAHLHDVVGRLIEQQGPAQTIAALNDLVRSIDLPVQRYPWLTTPIGNSFVFPARRTLKETMHQATARAAARKLLHNEAWSARTVHENGKPVIRLWRVQ